MKKVILAMAFFGLVASGHQLYAQEQNSKQQQSDQKAKREKEAVRIKDSLEQVKNAPGRMEKHRDIIRKPDTDTALAPPTTDTPIIPIDPTKPIQ